MSTEKEERAERRRVFENDQRVHKNTYLSHTHGDAGGRYAEINKSSVTGSAPTRPYPPAAHHQIDPSGIEPPLNYDINAVEPTGTHKEIEASLKALSEASGIKQSDASHGDGECAGIPAVMSAAPPSPPHPKRRIRR
jgi:hypothetical protein